jgi:hypothetical protein
MNRREAILAGVTDVSTAAAGASTAHAQASAGTNPDSEYIRTLLRLHKDALTDPELAQVLARVAEKAALMGTGPWEICSGPDGIKAAYERLCTAVDAGPQPFEFQFRIGGFASGMGWMMMAGDLTAKEDGKKWPDPFSLSLTVARRAGTWEVVAVQFATLTIRQAVHSLG